MDIVYLRGVEFIQWIQKFKVLESILTHVSNLGSPLSAYALVFPIAYYVNPFLGLVTMLCASFSEWISGILKWVLHGHRPYWWVYLYAQQTNTAVIPIEQFSVTCETGPGSPSGHCMVTMSSWVPLVLYLHQALPKLSITRCSRFYRDLVVLVFGCFVLLLSLSRCYLAAHFPHQVLAGTICGLSVGYMFYLTLPITKSNQSPRADRDNRLVQYFNHWFQQILLQPYQMIFLGLGSFGLAWLFSWVLQTVLGMDVNWSITLAQRACKRSEWVHLSTSLMVGFARIAGYLCGFALALQLNPPWTKSISQSYLSSFVILAGIVALIGTKLSESLCRVAVQTLASSFHQSISDSGPSSVLLLSSVFEGAMGPLVAVWFIPYFLKLRCPAGT